jgi:hypothetical protein
MTNIDEFLTSVNSSRKRTGVVYCSGLFNPIIKQFELKIPNLYLLDCTKLYKDNLTYSPKELLDKIEYESKDKITIVFNLEAFIVSNSDGFINQTAKLMTSREPSKPIFYFFYSKKIFRSFKDEYEAKELNNKNTIEL